MTTYVPILKKIATMVRILVVDDHPAITSGIKAFLEVEPDFEVVAVTHDSLEVLGILGQEKIDVVVLDYEMPVMDGEKLTRKIRKEFPNTKVLILTNFSESKLVINMLRAGARGYILKTASSDLIIQAVHTVAKDAMYFPPQLLQIIEDEQMFSEKGELITVTETETKVLNQMAKGLSAKEIAVEMNVAEATINTHTRNLRKKFDASNGIQLVMKAIKMGFIPLPK